MTESKPRSGKDQPTVHHCAQRYENTGEVGLRDQLLVGDQAVADWVTEAEKNVHGARPQKAKSLYGGPSLCTWASRFEDEGEISMGMKGCRQPKRPPSKVCRYRIFSVSPDQEGQQLVVYVYFSESTLCSFSGPNREFKGVGHSAPGAGRNPDFKIGE